MTAQKKQISFEEALTGLEQSADMLKQDDITLEAAIRFYEEGLNYYKRCGEILSEAKQKIELFDRQADQTGDFH